VSKKEKSKQVKERIGRRTDIISSSTRGAWVLIPTRVMSIEEARCLFDQLRSLFCELEHRR
jgi:hypothetical protein